MEKKEDFLVEHYRALSDLRSDFRNFNLFTLIAPMVNGETVVDIGSGSGFFACMLMERGKKVIGIEPNEAMRAISQKSNPEVVVVAGGAEDVQEVVTQPVHVVTMLDVLEHVEKDSEQVKKIYDALLPHGEFVIVVPSHPYLFGERDRGMHHFRRYTKESLSSVLTENGFQIIKMRHWNALGFFPYLVSEKLLHRPLKAEFRGNEKKGVLIQALRTVLHYWFAWIENVFDFGFGLSIIAIARKV